jgi:hypothetical protein
MSEQRLAFLQNSLISTCAIAALILLASFYLVVNGAFQRAAQHRLAGVDAATQPAAPTAQRAPARSDALLAHVGS